jgi:hypothetical protein
MTGRPVSVEVDGDVVDAEEPASSVVEGDPVDSVRCVVATPLPSLCLLAGCVVA